FDPRRLNFTLLTLILSLQVSYAAPLTLRAQNRQDDRDRVTYEQDRQRAERNLADTEYLAREVAALRIALRDVATRDFIRSELRDLLEELTTERARGVNPGGGGADRDTVRTSEVPGAAPVTGGARPLETTPDFSGQARRRLGDVLVESGLISQEQLATALAEQRDAAGPRRRLGQVVADLGFVSEREVA